MRRHLVDFARILAQAALILLGARALNAGHPLTQVIGLLLIIGGTGWREERARAAGRREGYAQGWKLRGTQTDALSYQHFLRQTAKARAEHLAGKDDA